MIRQAKSSDFEQITEIRKSFALDVSRLNEIEYRIKVQQNGFLLDRPLTYDEFEKDLANYIISEENNRVAGYMRIDHEQELKPNEEADWFKQDLRTIYMSKRHADIGGVGVNINMSNRGHATKLLEQAVTLSRYRKASYLFSFVIISPVTNFPSMMFHEKNGFERIAVMKPITLFNMNNFQSILYAKKL